jgi:YVTN family beta-propeller protein
LLAFSPTLRANNTVGAWDPTLYTWPLIPVHAVLTPDSRIVTYGTDGIARQTGYFIYDIWDINSGLTGGHLTLNNATSTDIFCGSQVVLPGGQQVFLAGGDNWTGTNTTNTGNNNSNLLTLSSNVLARANNMNRARWYSGSTVLLNGEVYIQGGSSGTDRPEVRQSNGTFRLLSNANTSTLDFMYPRNFIAPDGRVFGYDSNGRMYYVDPTGTGTITLGAQFASQYRGSDSSAVMFRPGRILQFGGNSNQALLIDITGGGTPVVTPTQSLSTQRRLVNAAVLPDGKVLATGGSQVNNQMTGVNNSAEIWNPTTGTWLQGPSGQRARLYHSMSMLLPDARVLVGGGGAPGPQQNMNMEVFLPPYLYDATGARAMQPRLTSAPAAIDIGETFFVDFTDAASISRVTMVKTGSVTHSWNMEQRFVELTFVRDGTRLRIQAPTKAADAPPGFWMLYALNENGVPSTARIIKINIAANWNPAITPVLTNPGNRTGQVASATSLQLSATDPNNDELGYGASGLPTGLSINATTGAITGTPTASGNFNVVVAASDGVNSATQAFVWTITDPAPLQVQLPSLPSPMLNGATATYTANITNGMNARVRWDFDDGTPVTEYSSNTTITHTFTRAGVFYVTVTATDDRGLPVSQTFVQVVHLPLTANRPTSSSSIAFETRAAGNRVWVVNADNDTASVFNAATNAKVGEVTVGTAPRTVAVAPDGRIWVTNKQSASISVIDSASLGVVQTVPLPRASQPYGIVFDPAGSAAFLSLEGTGQVLKLNPSTGAVLGTVNVGANPRHLSVNQNGQSVYVSRFVTPPVPGESTAAVQTGLGAAEVIVLSNSPFAAVRTIALAHSNLPDFETQGRGIPNYLGPAVVSPDGTQAWVPSKQDNIARGTLRDGSNIDFQNTVRAIGSRIDMASGNEDATARIDLDNSSLASAVAYDPLGVYMFVALETSREIAVVDAHGRWEVFRFDAGRAPQGLVVAPDGSKLFVNNFMDRTVGIYNLQPLLGTGATNVPVLATPNAVTTEKLTATVLKGKQFFYDARDTRLARDRYMSCATCHNDGGSDGRVWDLTGMGEGLRNTIALNGRGGMAQGFLHWSANFDEVQDFEGQIRTLAGGTGLMTDAAFATRTQPLGTAKAGVSADLDALAAYVTSLTTFSQSPYRNSDGSLTTLAAQGRTVFQNANCGSCHAGTTFTSSSEATLNNVGTIKQPGSGKRLNATLSGIDPPTLRDVWATAPYLHDGSAATLADAVRAHTGITLSTADVNAVSAYLAQIGSEEPTAPILTPTTAIRVNTGGGQYTDAAGQVWAADFGFNTGSVVNVSNAIAGTADPDLYRSERWDPPTGAELAYGFTVPNGTYTVKLHFAETWNGGQAVGSRIFDVLLENQLVLDNLDIFAEVGGYAALVKTFQATVADGQLNINFTHGTADDPQIGAIEILSTGTPPPPPTPDTQAPSVPQNLNGSAPSSGQVALSWAASTDTGGGVVAGYRIFRNGASIGTTAGTSYNDNSVAANTTYTYRVAAFDNAAPANQSAQSNEVTVSTPVAPATVIRVNSGGPQYTDTAGQVWSADTGFNTGSTVNVPNAIAGTSDPALYRTERWDPGTAPELAYAFTVPNGSYTVKLHFAETWSGGQAVGRRIFDVLLENQLVIDNLDIFAQVGGYAALIRTFQVTVSDGQMNINFVHGSADDPQIGAIEILSNGGPPPVDTQAPSVPQNLNGSAPTSSQVALTWTASTDQGGGSVAGYRIFRNGTAIGTATGTSYADNTVVANTTYTYRVAAYDNASPTNESAQSNQISVTTPAQSATVIRVNTGGPQYTDTAGQVWAADFGFTGGSTTTVSNQIFGTSDPALYQRDRWDPGAAPEMSYAFNVPNGTYTVKLHFVEHWSGGQAVGRRIFDVLLENQLVLDNLDIFAQAGGYTLLVKTFTATVSDGQMNINFVHGSVDDPIIGAIEILSNN